MRIRKNTTLSSLLLAAGCGGERPQTHVCHLNQSPWDVIPFSSSGAAAALSNQLDSSWFLPCSSSSSPRIHQMEGDDSFNGNVSLGDSTGAAESVVSVEKIDFMAAEDYEKSPANGSGWRSSSKGKKCKAHEPNSSHKTPGDQAAATSPPRRGRPRGTGKKGTATAATTTNPYEFYYYSGFGPRWGKRRGGGGGGKSVAEDEAVISNGNGDSVINSNVSKKSTSVEEDKTAAFGDGSSDYMEEEEDDVVEQDNDNAKMMMMTMTMKKRGRKPVKARSLKSLM